MIDRRLVATYLRLIVVLMDFRLVLKDLGSDLTVFRSLLKDLRLVLTDVKPALPLSLLRGELPPEPVFLVNSGLIWSCSC